MFTFSQHSQNNLSGVMPDLIGIAYRALSISPHDFGITEGLRSVERQKRLVFENKSQTLNSRHLTGEAIDFAVWIDGEITWEFERYREVAAAFKRAAAEYGLKITWGGEWKNFRDGPHIQLERQ